MIGLKKLAFKPMVIIKIVNIHSVPKNVNEMFQVNRNVKPINPTRDIINASSIEYKTSCANMGNSNADDVTIIAIFSDWAYIL